MKPPAAVTAFKAKHADWEAKIDAEYTNKTYILKNGDLEHYLGISKGLTGTISFCNANLIAYLADNSNTESLEIREIVRQVSI